MRFSINQQWLITLQQKGLVFWESKLSPRYQALDQREQKIVRIAAITLPLILIVFGIILPTLDKNRALHKEVSSLAEQVAEANQLADILVANPQQQGEQTNAGTSLLTQVDKIARQTGVRSFMTRLRPQQIMGGQSRLQAQIKDAPYHKVAAFLSTLEKRSLTISQLKIQATIVGHVDVQATIGD